jgi:hypothetical protein
VTSRAASWSGACSRSGCARNRKRHLLRRRNFQKHHRQRNSRSCAFGAAGGPWSDCGVCADKRVTAAAIPGMSR